MMIEARTWSSTTTHWECITALVEMEDTRQGRATWTIITSRADLCWEYPALSRVSLNISWTRATSLNEVASRVTHPKRMSSESKRSWQDSSKKESWGAKSCMKVPQVSKKDQYRQLDSGVTQVFITINLASHISTLTSIRQTTETAKALSHLTWIMHQLINSAGRTWFRSSSMNARSTEVTMQVPTANSNTAIIRMNTAKGIIHRGRRACC